MLKVWINVIGVKCRENGFIGVLINVIGVNCVVIIFGVEWGKM